jgi:DNA gyrase subunit B
LFEYLTSSALDGALFHPAKDAPAISPIALNNLVQQFRRYEKLLAKYSRRYNLDVLKSTTSQPVLDVNDFSSQEKMQNWTNGLESTLNNSVNKNQAFKVELSYIGASDHYVPKVKIYEHGAIFEVVLNKEFLVSKDNINMQNIKHELNSLVEDGAFVQVGVKVKQITSFDQGLSWLMDEAKRGQTIQRYKGLGEMNPEQLWETTMDPNIRRMLQVTIEDAVAADEIFTTLMGDCVEPRREFIETNALDAENIDIYWSTYPNLAATAVPLKMRRLSERSEECPAKWQGLYSALIIITF